MLNNNVHILGKNNFVDPAAKNVSITGNNNEVLGKISNVVIIGDNITVTESDTFWVDGIKRTSNTRARGGDVERKDSNFNVDIQVKQYLVDTTNGDVNIDMEGIFTDGDIYKGYKVSIKKLVQANSITFTSGNNISIDGDFNVAIINKDTNLQLWYEGFGRMYVV